MLYDKLKAYSKSGVYPFHMPGHKQKAISDLPYELDLTEIDGFDNLHAPTGCIRDIERKAEFLYNANRAFLLVNGATGGILAAVRAMTSFGDKVLLARNCHKSVYNAVELCGLDPVYIQPDMIEGTDIFGSIDPDMLDKKLTEEPCVNLVIITSPTYEGVCSDMESISLICRRHGAKLLADEAHGAHFPFSDAFPESAIDCGADVSVVSLHKTLPSPTQTALLLTNDKDLEAKLQNELAVFETSSPSYILMSGAEACLNNIDYNSFEEYTNLLDDFYTKAKSLNNFRLLYDLGTMYDHDFGKLVITTYGTNISGTRLAEILRERFAIEVEMAAAHYIIAITSVCDTKEGFDRLYKALSEIDKTVFKTFEAAEIKTPGLPEKRFSPFEARRKAKRTIAFENAAMKTSLDYIYAYPPGIPFIVPGEVITSEMTDYIKKLISSGVNVCSSSVKYPEYIGVADL